MALQRGEYCVRLWSAAVFAPLSVQSHHLVDVWERCVPRGEDPKRLLDGGRFGLARGPSQSPRRLPDFRWRSQPQCGTHRQGCRTVLARRVLYTAPVLLLLNLFRWTGRSQAEGKSSGRARTLLERCSNPRRLDERASGSLVVFLSSYLFTHFRPHPDRQCPQSFASSGRLSSAPSPLSPSDLAHHSS